MNQLEKLQFKGLVHAKLTAGRLRSEQLQDVTQEGTTNALAENQSQSHTFGLLEEEKSSIEAEINSHKPIGDTPAYRKFLEAIFPNRTSLNNTIMFPYLEEHRNALIVIAKLSALFGKTVRLSTREEAIKSMKANNHLAGYQGASSGRREYVGDFGYVWVDGVLRDGEAPYAGRNHLGYAVSSWSDPRNGHSVIPIFG